MSLRKTEKVAKELATRVQNNLVDNWLGSTEVREVRRCLKANEDIDITNKQKAKASKDINDALICLAELQDRIISIEDELLDTLQDAGLGSVS